MTSITDGVFFATIDRASRRVVEPRSLKFNFGDGYTQRVRDGIHTIKETYTANFVNRPESEIMQIEAFLEDRGGVDPFAFTPPHLPSFTGSMTFDASGYSITASPAGFTNSILSPVNPDMIIVENSASNDGYYNVDNSRVHTDSIIYTADALVNEGPTAGVTLSAAISVIALQWTQVYTRDVIYGLSVTLERAYYA